MKIFTTFVDFKNYVASVLYPQKCICCGEIIEEGEHICSYCNDKIEIINYKKRCMRCGKEKENCTCKSRVYYFQNVISCFNNDGLAKKAIYDYKLYHKIHYADFFAEYMADMIKKEYNNIHFDFICFVPTTFKNYIQRGFDQSEVLCRKISKILGIPMNSDILLSPIIWRSQHKSSYKKRFSNTRKKYEASHKIKAKNVLLIDDIMTTGATLSDCAHVLLLAGAENVYCATATSTIFKPKSKPNFKIRLKKILFGSIIY